MIYKKKCSKCKIIKSVEDFNKHKNRKYGIQDSCRKCCSVINKTRWEKPGTKEQALQHQIKRWNTEKGFLQWKYTSILQRAKRGPKHECYFTFDEFVAAWEKHKSIYGKRSCWGPPYREITMIYDPKVRSEWKNHHPGNLSPDRLDSSKPYTIQNLIFIRSDENNRKKDTNYKDCLIQIKLHEGRFINMEAI